MEPILVLLASIAIFGIIAAVVFRYLERKENIQQ